MKRTWLLCVMLAVMSPVEALASGGVTMASDGAELVLRVGETREVQAHGLTRIALGDPSVADVAAFGADSVRVTGTSPGTTTLLVWNARGKRISMTVVVQR